MTLAGASAPRIGIPWRSREEEQRGERRALQPYLDAVRQAGGEPVEISLTLVESGRLAELAETLDGFLLPGSPADVDPSWYHAERSPHCGPRDAFREQTDFALLDAACTAHQPVLAICYGLQSLNVFKGGRLLQDIAAEVPRALQHEWKRSTGAPEPRHPVEFVAGSRLAELLGSGTTEVNSSHHQAVAVVGRELRTVGWAPDGVVEAVEGTAAEHWVVGVQWHPERMPEDPLTRALFAAFVNAARQAGAQRSSGGNRRPGTATAESVSEERK
ncbi:MAG: gamma-glutamyl-gamma-aminobutyrate hydrolase family protein [Acidobacteriia bacterium]|jgi:putative glutamine amidotransferase|nr:gamma-glutamyl-gamma-aminobutyrate hydrolase family protein [Terriglobia bacterium]